MVRSFSLSVIISPPTPFPHLPSLTLGPSSKIPFTLSFKKDYKKLRMRNLKTVSALNPGKPAVFGTQALPLLASDHECNFPPTLPHGVVPYMSSRLYMPMHLIIRYFLPQFSKKWVSLLCLSINSLKKAWLLIPSPELKKQIPMVTDSCSPQKRKDRGRRLGLYQSSLNTYLQHLGNTLGFRDESWDMGLPRWY